MSIDKPSQPYPLSPATSPTSTPSPMPLFIPDPSIRGVSFDQLLSQRGIRVIHSRAIACPNVQSVNSSAHNPDCAFCDDSGILYYTPKEIWGIFSGNSVEKTFEAHGVWEIGSAVMTLPTEYPDGEQADFNTFDKLEFPDFQVRLWEMKEYEPRPDNIQKLRYPIAKVDIVMSISNGVQKMYVLDTDFTINVDGNIVWIAGREPWYDAARDVGETIAWSYFANPVYVVVQPLRELRITQELVNGVKQARRLPQQVLVKRDYTVNSADKLGISGT
jgi:hypothetical protein